MFIFLNWCICNTVFSSVRVDRWSLFAFISIQMSVRMHKFHFNHDFYFFFWSASPVSRQRDICLLNVTYLWNTNTVSSCYLCYWKVAFVRMKCFHLILDVAVQFCVLLFRRRRHHHHCRVVDVSVSHSFYAVSLVGCRRRYFYSVRTQQHVATDAMQCILNIWYIYTEDGSN